MQIYILAKANLTPLENTRTRYKFLHWELTVVCVCACVRVCVPDVCAWTSLVPIPAAHGLNHLSAKSKWYVSMS